MERMKIFPAASAQHFSVFVNFNTVRILMRRRLSLHHQHQILKVQGARCSGDKIVHFTILLLYKDKSDV